MDSLCGEPVCLWLPEKYKKPGTSTYVQGVEVEPEYSGVVPEGFDSIRLPASEYLMFQGEPFEEEHYCEAIKAVQKAMDRYVPSVIGYEWDDENPRIQLEPRGECGYIELRAVKEVAADYEKGISSAYFISSLTYGGVIEEILLRWFFMGLIALILVMIFARKTDKKEIPVCIFITANVIAALVFSVGHLPATQMFFGRITGLILFRCFLLNGSFALFFGRWFRKYGIQYAMLGHFGIHFISKIILICVL